MNEIEFDTDKDYAPNTFSYNTKSRSSGMAGILYKMGISDPAVANFVLIGIAGIFLGVTIFLYAGVLVKPKPNPTNAQELQRLGSMFSSNKGI